jgi:hypothetical protein
MADVDINSMTTTIDFEPEVVTSSVEQARQHVAQVAELKDLLRLAVMELIQEEIDLYMRGRG